MSARATTLCLIFFAGISQALAEPPANVLDLDRWKLTLPYNTSRAGNPDEVVHPELSNFEDPTSFFVSEAADTVIFRAKCGGLETKNSTYPRSELREMKPGGKDEASWSTDDGHTHELNLELAITQTPAVKQHVVCAQVHDPEDDVLMVRLEKKKLFIERSGTTDVPLDSNYKLGDKFQIRIVAAEGRIKVWYNESLKMDWETDRDDCYFKAGCYTQSNVSKGDLPEAYGEVTVSKLQLIHRD